MAPDVPRRERFEGHQYPQVIPEPAQIESGGPAPWASLDEQRRRDLSLDHVREAFARSGRLLATSSPPLAPKELELVEDASPAPITKRSAVLIALFEESGESHLVLTRRSLGLRFHKGEIALPGGRSDGDETPVATALREASEEVGLSPHLVTPLAWLNPIAAFGSGSTIWPVVGTLSSRPTLTANDAEVDRVFTVALKDLVAAGSFLEERWRREIPRYGQTPGAFYPIYFYRVPGELIWGATARILTDLLCTVVGVKWPVEEGATRPAP